MRSRCCGVGAMRSRAAVSMCGGEHRGGRGSVAAGAEESRPTTLPDGQLGGPGVNLHPWRNVRPRPSTFSSPVRVRAAPTRHCKPGCYRAGRSRHADPEAQRRTRPEAELR